MSGTLAELFAAGLLFVGTHFGVSSSPLRATLVGRFGERPYLAVYSTLSLALLVWMGAAYANAPAVTYWTAGTGVRHLAMAVMLIASVLLVAGLSTPNPTAVGAASSALTPVGIVKVTRHPVMWAIALWALVHVAANGDAASLIFFGWLALLALVGTVLLDRKYAARLGDAWRPFAATTSNLPFAALAARRATVTLKEIGYRRIAIGAAVFAILAVAHAPVFGVAPLIR